MNRGNCVRGHSVELFGHSKSGHCSQCRREDALARYYQNPTRERNRNRKKETIQRQRWREVNRDRDRVTGRRRVARKRNQLGLWWHLEDLLIVLLRKHQKGLCRYCGIEMLQEVPRHHPQKENLDHMSPLSKGGLHGFDNWVLSCRPCNQRKGAKEIN